MIFSVAIRIQCGKIIWYILHTDSFTEVHGTSDWNELLQRYSVKVSPWNDKDGEAVSEQCKVCKCVQGTVCEHNHLLSYVLPHLLTPWSRDLEKLTVSQLVKKFPTFYGTRRFITGFTSARHLPLSQVRSIQFMSPTPLPEYLS